MSWRLAVVGYFSDFGYVGEQSYLMDNGSRLQDALDRNRGRRIRPVWMARFQEITGYSITDTGFLSVLDTGRLKEAFFVRFRAHVGCSVREWHSRDLDKALSFLGVMNELVSSVKVLLFNDVDNYIGALRVPSNVVVEHVVDLRGLVREDIAIATEDLTSGMLFEFNYYSDSDEYSREGFYRLETWGIFCREHNKLS